MTTATLPRSLLTGFDISRDQFLDLVRSAGDLRQAKRAGREQRRLAGRNIALIFQKNSTRTRAAFEVAAYDQGAHVTFLGPDGTHIGREESIADTARVLGRLYDGIEFRGYAQASVDEFARHAAVPVWNGLTDEWHPTQMLADVLTMTDHQPGPIEDLSCCFLGDGRGNIARSLLVTGALLGMDIRIAAPPELQPPPEVRAIAERLAGTSAARLTVTADPLEGVRDAAYLYTDVWVSMGEADEEWARRIPLLTPYRVTGKLMSATGRADSRFLHCLPAIHDASTEIGRRVRAASGLVGAEVTDEVFHSPASVVFEQAENRMHTIKALLVAALCDDSPASG
jgi:ornithine carbamoyltransferase